MIVTFLQDMLDRLLASFVPDGQDVLRDARPIRNSLAEGRLVPTVGP